MYSKLKCWISTKIICIFLLMMIIVVSFKYYLDSRNTQDLLLLNISYPEEESVSINLRANQTKSSEEDNENEAINLDKEASEEDDKASDDDENNEISIKDISAEEQLEKTKTEKVTIRKNNFKNKDILVLSTVNLPKVGIAINNSEAIDKADCPDEPPNLVGTIKTNSIIVDRLKIKKELGSLLLPGGTFIPSECHVRHWIAIIVPIRNRDSQLSILLNNLHPVLIKQQIKYTFYVVEQTAEGEFNKGTLCNVGVVEALKDKKFDCFIFHDIDLLLENDRCLYTCPESTRHLSSAIDILNYTLPYEKFLGGVLAVPTAVYQLVNGYSNAYAGFGGDDDDFYTRHEYYGSKVMHYPEDIGRYSMTKNAVLARKEYRTSLANSFENRSTDGLYDLRYDLEDKRQFPLYTRLLVKLSNATLPTP